jgi:DNA-3-methyladenine glycosylase I
MLILEGFQAGLSWVTILKKEAAFDTAFDGFNPAIIANYNDEKIAELLSNPGIIRNKLKINAAVTNAQAALKLKSLDDFFWGYTDRKTIDNHLNRQDEMLVTSPLSDKISADLKNLGFMFVGSTIIYSYLQAIGIINDHLDSCSFR